jgi:hypothetical protein
MGIDPLDLGSANRCVTMGGGVGEQRKDRFLRRGVLGRGLVHPLLS